MIKVGKYCGCHAFALLCKSMRERRGGMAHIYGGWHSLEWCHGLAAGQAMREFSKHISVSLDQVPACPTTESSRLAAPSPAFTLPPASASPSHTVGKGRARERFRNPLLVHSGVCGEGRQYDAPQARHFSQVHSVPPGPTFLAARQRKGVPMQ